MYRHTLKTHYFCRTQKESQRKPIFEITEMERTPYPMSQIWQVATLLLSNMAGTRFHTPPTASMRCPVEMPANALWQVSYRCLRHTPLWPSILMYWCSLQVLLVYCGLLLNKTLSNSWFIFETLMHTFIIIFLFICSVDWGTRIGWVFFLKHQLPYLTLCVRLV